jgi:hypothetical protein
MAMIFFLFQEFYKAILPSSKAGHSNLSGEDQDLDPAVVRVSAQESAMAKDKPSQRLLLPAPRPPRPGPPGTFFKRLKLSAPMYLASLLGASALACKPDPPGA